MSIRKSLVPDFNSELKLKGFKAYETGSNSGGHSYSRKDFFKVSLTTGSFVFHFADRTFVTNETILFFGNPDIPYSCEVISLTSRGYTCLFSEEFLKVSERSESLHQSPLFKIGGTPILYINPGQTAFITAVFKNILAEQDTEYPFKDDLIRNYVKLIIHEALKMQLSPEFSTYRNAAQRATSVFLELLERQFPIESIELPLTLRTARHFAEYLSLDVNHLNRSVKAITGKTTTAWIAERIAGEAKALLLQTDWRISDIACSLGFEYPTYFNTFFKKMTGTNPRSLRA